MRYNAMEETYEEVTVLGHPMLCTAVRIDRSTVPKAVPAHTTVLYHQPSGC